MFRTTKQSLSNCFHMKRRLNPGRKQLILLFQERLEWYVIICYSRWGFRFIAFLFIYTIYKLLFELFVALVCHWFIWKDFNYFILVKSNITCKPWLVLKISFISSNLGFHLVVIDVIIYLCSKILINGYNQENHINK